MERHDGSIHQEIKHVCFYYKKKFLREDILLTHKKLFMKWITYSNAVNAIVSLIKKEVDQVFNKMQLREETIKRG